MPSEICLILHILRKSNSLIALLFILVIPSLKTAAKTCLPASMDVKFMFDSVRLGLSSSSSILQIADVVLRVVFLLFLLCF